MTRALVTKMLRALDASRDDVNECLNEVLPKAGSYRYDRVIDSLTAKLAKHDAAITAAREYLATEPSSERVEWIAKLRTGWTVMEESEFERLDDLCMKAADMLEADAQQAKRVLMTAGEIAKISERMEASDPTDSFWREFSRAIEAHHGITEQGN